MEQIKFSQNWNKKLDCDFFTTIRLQSSKYVKDNEFKIFLKNEIHCKAKIIDVWTCKIDMLKDFICYIDTGYNKEETMNMFKKMYSNVDFTKTNLVVVLLKKTI